MTTLDKGQVPRSEGADREFGWGRLGRLIWFITVIPALGVVGFETLRHEFLEETIPRLEGNILAGVLAVALALAISRVTFGVINRLHRQTLNNQREIVTLGAAVEERERLSRDLHDGVAQIVSYLLLRLDTVSDLVAAGRLEDARLELNELRTVTDGLHADVRDSISGLRSRVVEAGIVRALHEYADEFEERHGVRVSLDAEAGTTVPPFAGLQLFGIAQEALANVRKHSGAKDAHISIRFPSPGMLEFVIADDGRGFDATQSQTRSVGFISMRERAQSLGGTCQIESGRATGTKVVVTIPLPVEAKRKKHETLTIAAR